MEKLKASLTPAKQGELDSLCGLYSVINSLYWLYGRKIRRKPLFRALVHHLSQHSSIDECLTNGMESPQIDCLLHFLQISRYKRYPIAVHRPFLTQPNVSTKTIFAQCQQWLEHSHRVVLLGDQYHWSVITHVDNDWLCFLIAVHVNIFTDIVGHYATSRVNTNYLEMRFTLLSGETAMTPFEHLLIE